MTAEKEKMDNGPTPKQIDFAIKLLGKLCAAIRCHAALQESTTQRALPVTPLKSAQELCNHLNTFQGTADDVAEFVRLATLFDEEVGTAKRQISRSANSIAVASKEASKRLRQSR